MLPFNAHMLSEYKVIGGVAKTGIQIYGLSRGNGPDTALIFSPEIEHNAEAVAGKLKITAKGSFWNTLFDLYKEVKESGEGRETLGDHYAKSPTWPFTVGRNKYGSATKDNLMVRKFLAKNKLEDFFEIDSSNFSDPDIAKAAEELYRTDTDGGGLLGDLVSIVGNCDRTGSSQEPTGPKYLLHWNNKYKDDKLTKAGEPRLTSWSTEHVVRASDYIVVDHDQKVVYPKDETEKNQSRMGTYGNSKASWTMLRHDFSMTDGTIVQKLLASLVKAEPSVIEYEYIDTYHNDQRLPMRDAMARGGSGRFGALKKSASALRQGSGPITAYHGTSNAIWKEIKKSGGMVPGLGPEYNDKLDGHSEAILYMTTDLTMARRYAVRAAKSSKGVILETTITDHSRITFDEDNLHYQAMGRFLRKLTPEQFKKLAADAGLDGIDHPGALARGYQTGADPKDPKIRRIIDTIGRFAIGLFSQNGFSFGYRGSIPASKFRVIEEVKGVRYDDKYGPESDEKNAEAYQKTRDSRNYYGDDI
jgi:hypothetical protein